MKSSSRRLAALSVLLVVGGSIAAATYQAGPGGGRQGRGADGAQVIQVDKLKDNLFVLKGGGGNTAVFIAGDGATSGAATRTATPGPCFRRFA